MNDFPLLKSSAEDGAISFARSFVKSDAFMTLFREGMGLVEHTASYLDGDGRTQAAVLPRNVSLTYATESMRLTTRLMQLASWLLVQRAVAEGEMTAEQARAENNKVRISETMPQPASEEAELLPETLRELVDHSLRLQNRIRHLEKQMTGVNAPVMFANPVRHQIQNLQARLAFGG